MNCIWILLLLCLCNGKGCGENSDCQIGCDERRNRRSGNDDCDCEKMGRGSCSMEKGSCGMDRDDRRDHGRNDRRDDRRFPMPPFAPETGCCCEASDSSMTMEENKME